jgi:hypothetical protein
MTVRKTYAYELRFCPIHGCAPKDRKKSGKSDISHHTGGYLPYQVPPTREQGPDLTVPVQVPTRYRYVYVRWTRGLRSVSRSVVFRPTAGG